MYVFIINPVNKSSSIQFMSILKLPLVNQQIFNKENSVLLGKLFKKIKNNTLYIIFAKILSLKDKYMYLFTTFLYLINSNRTS